jgi:hypothetical protein
MIEILNPDPRLAQTVTDGLFRKPCRMLKTIEPLLLSRSDQPSIADDRRRRIPVISINP